MLLLLRRLQPILPAPALIDTAITLYETSGFQHMPPKPTPYKRADVFMELNLEPEWVKYL